MLFVDLEFCTDRQDEERRRKDDDQLMPGTKRCGNAGLQGQFHYYVHTGRQMGGKVGAGPYAKTDAWVLDT